MARVQIHQPDHYRFATEIQVRITDTNYGGHLGNDALLSMIHEARVRFFAAMGFTEMDVDGVGIILSDSAIRYCSEAFQGEVLVFEVDVTELSRRGCDITYRVRERDSGRVVALAKTGIVFYDYASRGVRSRPAGFDRALALLGQQVA